MKKSLAISICMLALAVLTLCGVTFAYFSSGGEGSSGSVQIGGFVFTGDATALTDTGEFTFRAPTVLNVPEVTDGGAGTDAHTRYLTDGDDAYFDAYCLPVQIEVTNRSRTDMNLNVRITAERKTAAGIYEPDAQGLVKQFVFADADSAELLGGDAAQKGKYGKKIRTRSLAAPLTTAEQTDVDGGLSPLKETELRLVAGMRETDAALAALRLTALRASDDAVSENGSVTLAAAVWMDYRVYRDIVAADRSRALEIRLTVTVTATNRFAA